MIHFSIKQVDSKHRPSINFEEKYSLLNEVNSCDTDYILNEVIPNLDKIMRGELIQDPCRQDEHLIDSYEFGYTAVMVEVFKEKTFIDDTWDDNFVKLEISSKEIYHSIKKWGEYLTEWTNNQNV